VLELDARDQLEYLTEHAAVLVQIFRAVEPLPECVAPVRPKARRPRERARAGPRCADDPG
jgi:hypothetical protein